MIVLVDNYDSFTFNLVHYLGGLGADVAVHRNDKISVKDVLAQKPEAIVLSPGPCTPNEAGICLDLIEQASASSGPRSPSIATTRSRLRTCWPPSPRPLCFPPAPARRTRPASVLI